MSNVNNNIYLLYVRTIISIWFRWSWTLGVTQIHFFVSTVCNLLTSTRPTKVRHQVKFSNVTTFWILFLCRRLSFILDMLCECNFFFYKVLTFDLAASKRMRANYRSAFDDINRRQALLQELMQTNNQLRLDRNLCIFNTSLIPTEYHLDHQQNICPCSVLSREELSAQTRVSQKYESRTDDLRAMLQNSKMKLEVIDPEMHLTAS